MVHENRARIAFLGGSGKGRVEIDKPMPMQHVKPSPTNGVFFATKVEE